MRAVLQRACGARVSVAGEVVSSFDGEGLVVLAGVCHEDTSEDVDYLARKIADLRILREERSVSDQKAPVIVISQFTLYADTRKGRRPSWNAAAPGPVAQPMVQQLIEALKARGLDVGSGVFGADMAVELTNDGPVTILLDSRAR